MSQDAEAKEQAKLEFFRFYDRYCSAESLRGSIPRPYTMLPDGSFVYPIEAERYRWADMPHRATLEGSPPVGYFAPKCAKCGSRRTGRVGDTAWRLCHSCSSTGKLVVGPNGAVVEPFTQTLELGRSVGSSSAPDPIQADRQSRSDEAARDSNKGDKTP